LGNNAAFKLLSAPQEGECANETNPSLEAGINNANVAEGSGSASQPIAKRLRSAKGKEVSEVSRQNKKRKAPSPQQPYMTQNAPPYSIVSDLLNTKANITFGQLMAMPPYRNDVRKATAPKRAKIAKVANHTKVDGNTPMMCKAQVAGWKVEVILDSGSSISIVSKKFMESLGRRVEKPSERRITGIHGEKRPSLGIVTQVPVKIGSVTVAVDTEVIDASGYSLVLGTDWLKRANAIIDYQDCKLTLRDEKGTISVPCRNTSEMSLDSDDGSDSESEGEYDESSEDSDAEIDDEETNFVGLSYSLPQQGTNVKYKITSEGIRTNSECTSWETYDYLTYCFDVVRKKKKHKQGRRSATGPKSSCWCEKYLETREDKCETCEEQLQEWEAVSILPQKEVEDVRCNLTQGGVEILEENRYKPLINEIIGEFPNLAASDLSQLGKTDIYQHTIDVKDAKPIKLHPYRTSPRHLSFLKEEIERMITNGLIKKSFSPWSAPTVVVNKKNGKFRLCIDYRKLNAVTKPDAYPVPRIADMLDALGHSAFFSTLDLASGFWQVEVAAKDREKTAFTTPFGIYEFLVMPFGLINAPATFQRVMDRVFHEVAWKFVLVYIDDIIIYSKTREEHEKHLRVVFTLLRNAGLKINLEKCDFFRTRLAFLGHIITIEGIALDPAKIEKVKSYPVPRDKTNVRAFLGLASYYRRFVREFSTVAKPLHNLTKRDVVFEWKNEHQSAFDVLKGRLTSAPIMTYPDFSKQFILATDASDCGIGAVLSQKDTENHEHPVAYASRLLSSTEQNYTVVERECLAAIWAVRHFRHYLHGPKFDLYTDNLALTWLKNRPQPKGRIARWIFELSEYDYEIIHKQGRLNANADTLSRIKY
jgi:hypothetical protein